MVDVCRCKCGHPHWDKVRGAPVDYGRSRRFEGPVCRNQIIAGGLTEAAQSMFPSQTRLSVTRSRWVASRRDWAHQLEPHPPGHLNARFCVGWRTQRFKSWF